MANSRRAIAAAVAMAGVAVVAAASERTIESGTQPLQMQWSQHGDMVNIQLVGQSDVPLNLHYTLKVNADSRSVNSGRARLGATQPVTVATINVSARSDWNAELSVTGDRDYSQKASNPADGS